MTEWIDPAIQVAYRSLGLSLWMMEDSIDDLRGTDRMEILTWLAEIRDAIVDIRERLEDILMDMEVVP